MVITEVYASVGGKEVTCVDEQGERYTISLADARKTGIARYLEDPALLPEEEDGEMLDFLARKMRCVRYAAYLLGFGDKTRKALLMKLRAKDYEPDVCEAALAVLENNGLLDDERLCARRVETLAHGKLYGPRRIKSELIAKGFTSSQAENALDEAEIDFDELLKELIHKLTRSRMPADEKELAAFKNKLVRYGYSYSSVSQALADFAAYDE